MIRYRGFTKRYGRVVAVREVDLEVRPGETLALVGPNGSGKTTMLKAALGLVRPTAGRIEVAGCDVRTAGRAARSHLGYLPQRFSFPEASTGRELMEYYARLRRADPREVDRLLERVGLVGAAGRPTEGFSGGMSQRLGIAVALLGGPRALVLDEPTAALDPTGSLAVRELVAGIRAEGTTVLLSSHDLAEVAALADRVAVCMDGRLQALGEPDALVRGLGLSAMLRIGVRSEDGGVAAAAERAGARSIRWDGAALCCEVAPGGEATVLEAVRGAGLGVTDLTVRSPGLEEVYRVVTAPDFARVA